MNNILTLEKTTPNLAGGKRIRLLSYNIQVGIGSVSYRHYVTEAWKHVLPHAQLYENMLNSARDSRI